jgi:hypothetical protein
MGLYICCICVSSYVKHVGACVIGRSQTGWKSKERGKETKSSKEGKNACLTVARTGVSGRRCYKCDGDLLVSVPILSSLSRLFLPLCPNSFFGNALQAS